MLACASSSLDLCRLSLVGLSVVLRALFCSYASLVECSFKSARVAVLLFLVKWPVVFSVC